MSNNTGDTDPLDRIIVDKDDINQLVEDGLLFELDKRNNETTYYVTRTGEDYVGDEFDIQLENPP